MFIQLLYNIHDSLTVDMQALVPIRARKFPEADVHAPSCDPESRRRRSSTP